MQYFSDEEHKFNLENTAIFQGEHFLNAIWCIYDDGFIIVSICKVVFVLQNKNFHYTKLQHYQRQQKAENKTCQWFFNQTHSNNDNYVDVHELVYVARDALPVRLSNLKAQQINCTACM